MASFSLSCSPLLPSPDLKGLHKTQYTPELLIRDRNKLLNEWKTNPENLDLCQIKDRCSTESVSYIAGFFRFKIPGNLFRLFVRGKYVKKTKHLTISEIICLKIRYDDTYIDFKNKYVKSELTEAATADALQSCQEVSQKLIQEFFPELKMPKFKVVNQTRATWLGRAEMSSRMALPEIKIQQSIVNDPETLERVLAHELIHCLMYLTEPTYVQFFQSHNPQEQRRLKYNLQDGHGEFFQEWAAKINSKKGKDFVTKTSNENYKIEESKKEFYILIEKMPDGSFVYGSFLRYSPQIKNEISKIQSRGDAKLFKIQDHDFVASKSLAQGRFKPNLPEKQKKLQDIFESGTPLTVEASALTEANLETIEPEQIVQYYPVSKAKANETVSIYETVEDSLNTTNENNSEISLSRLGMYYDMNGEVWTEKNSLKKHCKSSMMGRRLLWPEVSVESKLQKSDLKLKRLLLPYLNPLLLQQIPNETQNKFKAWIERLSSKEIEPIAEFESFDDRFGILCRVRVDSSSWRLIFSAWFYPTLDDIFLSFEKILDKSKEEYPKNFQEIIQSHVILATITKPAFKKTPVLWDGKAPKEAYMGFDDKVYVIQGSETQWIKDYVDMPESDLYYLFFAKPDPTKPGETTEDPPLPPTIPDEFFQMYRTAVFAREFSFKSYKVGKGLQTLILKVISSRHDKPPGLIVQTITPVKTKKVITRDFLRKGLVALSSLDTAGIEIPKILYHGTNVTDEFDTLKPNPHGVIWLTDDFEAAERYAKTYYRKGIPRVFEVTLANNAKVVDLRDPEDPVTAQIKKSVEIERSSFSGESHIPDENWPQYAGFNLLEDVHGMGVGILLENKVDVAICKDFNAAYDHLSYAVLNPGIIESNELIESEIVSTYNTVEDYLNLTNGNNSIISSSQVDINCDIVEASCGNEKILSEPSRSWKKTGSGSFKRVTAAKPLTLKSISSKRLSLPLDQKELTISQLQKRTPPPPVQKKFEKWLETLSLIPVAPVLPVTPHPDLGADCFKVMLRSKVDKDSPWRLVFTAFYFSDLSRDLFLDFHSIINKNIGERYPTSYTAPVLASTVLASPYEDEGFVGKYWGSQASGILFKCEEKVLLLKRATWVEDPGTWGIPGGAVPVDENSKPMDVKQAALKEVEEEISGMPEHRDTGKHVVFQDGKFKYTTYLFEVDEEFSPILNDEHTDFAWVEISEILK